jgi:hypothetical protein
MASTRLVDIAPILPVRDLWAALAHYESLGFRVHTYDDGDDYGLVSRNGVEPHLTYQPTSYYPDGAFAVVYLSVKGVVFSSVTRSTNLSASRISTIGMAQLSTRFSRRESSWCASR